MNMKFYVTLVLLICIAQSAHSNQRCQNIFRDVYIELYGPEVYGIRQTSGLYTDGVPNSYQALKLASGSSLNFNNLSAADQRSLHFWLNLSKDKPAISRDIYTENLWNSNKQESFVICGTCKKMLPLHIRSLVLPFLRAMGRLSAEDHRLLDPQARIASGKVVLVFHKNKLLGSVKVLGSEGYKIDEDGYFRQDSTTLYPEVSTPTFLALRNWIDDQGKLQLVTGGTYYISRPFYEDLLRILNEQGPYSQTTSDPNSKVQHFLNHFQLGLIHVDHWTVKPETFLFNNHGLDAPENRPLLDALFPEQQGTYQAREQTQHQWQEFLKVLMDIRTFIEQQQGESPSLEALRDLMSTWEPTFLYSSPENFQINETPSVIQTVSPFDSPY